MQHHHMDGMEMGEAMDTIQQTHTHHHHTMTFQGFTEYKTQILFSFWTIDTIEQYIISFMIVVGLGILHHALKARVKSLEDFIAKTKKSQTRGILAIINNDASSLSMWYVWHAVLTTSSYGLALILMLIAMSYNPGLFLALCIGYGAGDYLFYSRESPYQQVDKLRDDLQCH